MTPKLAQFLREYRAERLALYRQLGKELSPDDLVFASAEGKPIAPGVLTHNFARIVKRAGLEGVRFHDLRHTFASLMLLRGAKPKVISEALGHSSVAFTMDVCSHIIEGMQEDAMALLDEVLPPGGNGAFQKINDNFLRISFGCQRSSVEEQRFRKARAVGSNPSAGWSGR
jgi:integrase